MPTAKQAPRASETAGQAGQSPVLSRARAEGKCALCGRLASDMDTCGSTVTCARATVELAPDDVIVECKTCGTTRVVSTGLALKGKPAIGRGAEGAVCKCGESQVARIIG